MKTSRKPFGFTLINLMIVVAIVGILAAIAYPSYMSYLQQSRRQVAITAMRAIQLAEEDYFVRKGHYACFGYGGYPGSGLDLASVDSLDKAVDYYKFKVKSNTTNCSEYKIVAKARSGTSQADDAPCTKLVMNKVGPMGNESCWPG